MFAQKDGRLGLGVEEESVFAMVDKGIGENPSFIVQEKGIEAVME